MDYLLGPYGPNESGLCLLKNYLLIFNFTCFADLFLFPCQKFQYTFSFFIFIIVLVLFIFVILIIIFCFSLFVSCFFNLFILFDYSPLGFLYILFVMCLVILIHVYLLAPVLHFLFFVI